MLRAARPTGSPTTTVTRPATTQSATGTEETAPTPPAPAGSPDLGAGITGKVGLPCVAASFARTF